MTLDDWSENGLLPLLRFATVLSGSRHLGEDVVQDVLVKAHRDWARVVGADRPDAYLRRMVVNEFLSWRRKWSSRRSTRAACLATAGSPAAGGSGWWLRSPPSPAAAIVIPVVVLTRTDPDTATPPAPDRLSIAQEFRFDPPARWQEVGRSIQLDQQNLIVAGPAEAQCEVNVHRPGGFDAGRIPAGSAPLTVNGRSGYFARIVNPTDVERRGAGPTPTVIDTPDYARWTVVWQYAEGAWAVVVCPIGGAQQDISAAEARRRELLVAAGLTFERGAQRVPFKAGYLPPASRP